MSEIEKRAPLEQQQEWRERAWKEGKVELVIELSHFDDSGCSATAYDKNGNRVGQTRVGLLKNDSDYQKDHFWKELGRFLLGIGRQGWLGFKGLRP